MKLKAATVHERCLLALMLLIPVHVVDAQGFATQTSYDEELKKARNFAALDDSLFGEQINLQDGTVSFSQTDVSVRTNSGTSLQFGRISETRTTIPGFGHHWGVEVPYMVGTYDTRSGWNVAGAGDARCSTGKFAPRSENLLYVTQNTTQQTTTTTTSNITSPAHVFWHGIEINIPSVGAEQLLEKNPSQTVPSNTSSYHGTTKSQWRVACIPTLKNGTGEGFAVLLPNGTTYHFDWLAQIGTRPYKEYTGSTTWLNPINYSYQLPLAEYFILATKSVDRFGNTITYQYNPDKPWQLQSIVSDDGARIDVEYEGYGGMYVTGVTSGTRHWAYQYNGVEFPEGSGFYPFMTLAAVVLPDTTRWTFEGTHATSFGEAWDFLETWKVLIGNFWGDNFAKNCASTKRRLGAARSDPVNEYTFTMTHPSGAKGAFTFQHMFHGMNNAPGQCHITKPPVPGGFISGYLNNTSGVPAVYIAKSLKQKKISGPGMPGDRAWNYAYDSSWSFAHECQSNPQSCDNYTKTTVTSNDGVVRRYLIGNDYSTNQGQRQGETVEKNGTVYATETYEYVLSAIGQAFPDDTGDIPRGTGVADLYGNPFLNKNRPLNRRISQVDSVTYAAYTTQFSIFARPVSTTKSNTLGYSRTDVTEYADDFALWVLQQPKRGYNVGTGIVEYETGYNAQALPEWTKKYGKLQQTVTYNTNGTVATIADGGNNVTKLSSWKRGIPQLIQHPTTPEAPTGAIESAFVNDNGWITSSTDENGYTHGYGYDAMGRLASIVYPSGVNDAWASKGFESRPLTANDWLPPGISVGQWRHYEGQGNYAKFTYFDAMWRPVLALEYDTSTVAPTVRYTRTAYDSNGRVSFQSYPVSDPATTTTGIRTFYDALDRVTSVEQDSEHNVLTTTTEYLAGLQVRVTNPRNLATTTGFMAWDQPGYDLPLWSSQPEAKVIEISRHPQFGWPLQLKQRSADNSLQASRQYVYDGNAQLCKTIEPETGASVMGYDAAGNLAWQVSGLPASSFSSTNDCQHVAAAGTGLAVGRTYDNRNRLTHLTFPDGKGNQIWTYEKDNLPASVTAYNGTGNTAPVVTAYTYNKRRLLTGESLSQPSYTWGIGYEYDSIGNLRWQSYPTGLKLDFAPNALGQATQARNANQSSIYYASGAQYFPNGALKQFTYGNGIVHSMTQNARQLPARVTSSGNVLDFGYDYDKNANPTAILDYVTGTPTAQHRWMTYDGLGRLITSGSAMFGGSDHTHRFTYDALDNIESWKHAGAKDYADYVYDAQNRLTNIRNTAGASVVGIGYDPQGNLANKNGQAYDFDYGNRLRTVQGKESYRYDGLGRRVQTTKFDDSQTTLWQYGQAGQMLFSTDWEGSNYLNQKTHEYVYLAGSLIATIDHAWPSNAIIATKYQHTDALGSPVAVTNEAGTVIERNNYEPYGAIIGNPARSGIGYTGHVMDGATGLIYMQQRYYDQSIGRFLSIDPVTANSATGRNFNRYLYANNSAYKFTDPDGRRSLIADGQIHIQPEDKSVPMLPGIPNTVDAKGISPSDFSFHTYDVKTDSSLSVTQAGNGFKNNPTPGNDKPASMMGTRNDVGAIPTTDGTNMVKTFIVPSPDPSRFSDITVNYTVADEHGLQEGFVMRYGEIGPNGTILRSYGEGNNWRQHPGLENIPFGWGPQVQEVWQQNHQEIINEAR